MSSLSLYPIKYLNEPYLRYGSFLETKILLTLMSSIFNSFFIEIVFIDHFVVENYVRLTHSYMVQKKLFFENLCLYKLHIFWFKNCCKFVVHIAPLRTNHLSITFFLLLIGTIAMSSISISIFRQTRKFFIF